MKKWLFVIAILVAAVATAFAIRDIGGHDSGATPTPAAARDTETVAEDLDVPWDVAFTSAEKALITERPGQVRLWENGAIQPDPVLRVATTQEGEGGLLGLALSPDFQKDRFVYLYVSRQTGSTLTNRVVRYTLSPKDILGSPRTLLDGIPGAVNHNGGRLRFGPDKKLYVTTGDAQDPDRAQNTSSLSGKILRLNPDGSRPADNPFGNLVWSYGHRNPQGLAWDKSGQLYETEHGPSGEFGLCCRDEFNKIERGGNYGWPLINGGQTRFGLGTPILGSGNSVAWAPASLVFYQEKMYFGALRGQHLHEVTLAGGKVISDRELYLKQFGRIRTVVAGPDGKLYLLTSNRDGRGKERPGDDKMIRINRLKK